MLAMSARDLRGDNWALEPKLDGWRAVIHVGRGDLRIYTRPGREVSRSVPRLRSLTDSVSPGTVLDGELVLGSGRSASFYRLAPEVAAAGNRVTFAAFDLLALGGRSLVSLTYEERRRLLTDLRVAGPSWCTVPAWTGIEISDLLSACELHDIEGLVAKKLQSRYRPGQRSPDWVKVKTLSWRSRHAPLRSDRSGRR
jgi:bifunctional non-homologous end joining protein LigD